MAFSPLVARVKLLPPFSNPDSHNWLYGQGLQSPCRPKGLTPTLPEICFWFYWDPQTLSSLALAPFSSLIPRGLSRGQGELQLILANSGWYLKANFLVPTMLPIQTRVWNVIRWIKKVSQSKHYMVRWELFYYETWAWSDWHMCFVFEVSKVYLLS